MTLGRVGEMWADSSATTVASAAVRAIGWTCATLGVAIGVSNGGVVAIGTLTGVCTTMVVAGGRWLLRSIAHQLAENVRQPLEKRYDKTDERLERLERQQAEFAAELVRHDMRVRAAASPRRRTDDDGADWENARGEIPPYQEG